MLTGEEEFPDVETASELVQLVVMSLKIITAEELTSVCIFLTC